MRCRPVQHDESVGEQEFFASDRNGIISNRIEKKGEAPVDRKDIIGYISEHKVELEQKFGVRRIGIFGSYARGESRDDSDIDVVVELRKPDMFCLVGIKQTIEDALQRKVDIVRLRDKMSVSLRRRIERDAVYV